MTRSNVLSWSQLYCQPYNSEWMRKLIPRSRHSLTVSGYGVLPHSFSHRSRRCLDIRFPSHRIYYIRSLEEPTLPDDETAVHPLQETLCYPPDGHRLWSYPFQRPHSHSPSRSV